MDTVKDWSVLMTAFAAEWMELEGFLDHAEHVRREEDSEELEAIRLNKKTEL
jgi:hypothetical protein